jgi:xanthine dehydrogenase YagS FAD-binding subunit
LQEASSLLTSNANSIAIAGGTRLLYTLKQDNLPTQSTVLVDLKSIPNLDYITQSNGVLAIGPNTKLVEIANSATVQGSYAALAQAAAAVATPVLRNMGTIAGNIAQDVWCWYFRGTDNVFFCIRKGGAICYAQAGDNRFYHSIFGGPQGCYSVHPSDTAIALSALNASVVTTSKTYTMDQFFSPASPGNVLAQGELIKEIDIPTPAAGSASAFIKLAQRPSLNFALASAAAWYTPATGAVTSCRIYLGGVSQVPVHATAAETAITGKSITAATALAAGQAAVTNAAPLTGNSYKKQLAAVAIARALQA